jgi:hypothetical protein
VDFVDRDLAAGVHYRAGLGEVDRRVKRVRLDDRVATCPLGAIDISASPMLHVWIVNNPTGGPFAVDIDPGVVKAIDRA